MNEIKMKRIYAKAEESDGIRVLVDRIWPRGMTKEEARLDFWMKEIAPSPELRKWFSHLPERFEAFRTRYLDELSGEAAQPCLKRLRRLVLKDKLTLLYAAKDERHNQAVILKEVLKKGLH